MTRDNSMIKSMIDDRLANNYIGLKFARDLAITFSSMDSLLSEFRHPVFIIHGQKDQLFPFRTSETLFRKIGSPDKNFELLENHYHELYIDQDREEVLDQMIGWLDARAPSAKALRYIPTLKAGVKGKNAQLKKAKTFGKIFLVGIYFVILRHLNRIPAYRRSRVKLIFFPLFWAFKYVCLLSLISANKLETFINQILVESA
jgi:Serine aminopeptidase, S33